MSGSSVSGKDQRCSLSKRSRKEEKSAGSFSAAESLLTFFSIYMGGKSCGLEA